MGKEFSINVSYGESSKIISGQREKIAREIESFFGIRLKDVSMYKVDKEGATSPVSLNTIDNFMKIKMVPKMNGQKTLRNHELDSSQKLRESIALKLERNTPLTGPERKMLLEAIQTNSTPIVKRKLDQTDIRKKPNVSHKKVQVCVAAINIKESFAQTDPINIDKSNEYDEEEAIVTLKKLWYAENKSYEQIEYYMKETYDDRRIFIHTKNPLVKTIKEKYPALFCLEQVKNELDRIFYPGKYAEFLSNMHKYSKYLQDYKDGFGDIQQVIDEALKNARTPMQKAYAEVVGSVFILAKLLDENYGFIHLQDCSHGSSDVYPYIDASNHSLKEMFYEGVNFHIVVEEQHLCKASNFPEAILCLVSSFFIFNIDYPKHCRRILTVFEKLYLKANDTLDIEDITLQVIKLFDLLHKDKEANKKLLS